MKKIVGFVIALLVVIGGSTISTVEAKSIYIDGSNHPDNYFDDFIVHLFDQEVQAAMTDYYQGKVANPGELIAFHDWKDKEHKVLEVFQEEKGVDLETPYVFKITYKASLYQKILGTDTVEFGLTPKGSGGGFEVKVLEYKHRPYKD